MRIIWLLLFCCTVFFVHSAEKQSKAFILHSGEVHEGDLFAAAGTIEISGRVTGDLYVVGGHVVIDGVIEGDLLGIAGSTDIRGSIGRNCRLIAGYLLVSGKVKGNFSSLTTHLQFLPTSSIGGNLVAASINTELGGPIGGNATLVAANTRASSLIEKNLQGYMNHLRITSQAQIEGNVDYRSNKQASIDTGAVIKGKILYRPSLIQKIADKHWLNRLLIGSQVAATAMNILYTLVIGWVLLRFFPTNLHSSLKALGERPIKASLYGLLFIILMPLLFLILLISILGIPFALTLMAFNIVGFYSAKVYPLLWLSEWAKHKFHRKKLTVFFIFATIIYFILTNIPVIGALVAFVALLLGLGAWILSQITPQKKLFGRF